MRLARLTFRWSLLAIVLTCMVKTLITSEITTQISLGQPDASSLIRDKSPQDPKDNSKASTTTTPTPSGLQQGQGQDQSQDQEKHKHKQNQKQKPQQHQAATSNHDHDHEQDQDQDRDHSKDGKTATSSRSISTEQISKQPSRQESRPQATQALPLTGAPSEPATSDPEQPSADQPTSASALEDDDDSAGRSGHLRFELQRYDGWYNNLANADWGSPNSRLRRKVAPAYSDGVYQMLDEPERPSARRLSQQMMRGDDGHASARNLTNLFAFFGQLISSEVLMASESGCPIEIHRIAIDKCDPMYDRDCRGGRSMPFYRADYDHATGQSPNLPREQLNKVTSWIDASFVYSTSETWLNSMRSFDGSGTLKMAPGSPPLGGAYAATSLGAAAAQDRSTLSLFGYPVRNKQRAPLINQMPAHHLKMRSAERMFLLGDPRTNQNPVILAFGILFYRWHNVLAERIHSQHPDWTDEEIFQRARRLVIASMQNIILYEYLPVLLDTPSPHAHTYANESSALSSHAHEDDDPEDLIRPYEGYKPDLHPGISHVFQSAAFRFGHTMIPPGLYVRDHNCKFMETPNGYKGIRLCSTWWNAEEVVSQTGIEQLLMGAASQVAEREDYVLCNDVRDKLFGPLDFSRRDLAALNIMRGRDNGLADYNTVRQAFKLAKVTQWRDINPRLHAKQPELFEQLAKLYNNQLDRVDVYVGGMLESDLERGRPGPLFRRIIREQFERLRDSDRFWFENTESGIFSAAEIEQIRQITLYDIIVNSTLIPEQAIQRNLFMFKPRDPCPQPGQLSSSQLQPCYVIKGHSYFKGSELAYVLVCTTLVLIPAICALCAYLIVNWQDRKRRQFKTRQEYERSAKVNSNINNTQVSSHDELHQAKNIPSKGFKSSNSSKFYAKEWLHSNLKRKIKLKMGPAPDETIYVLDAKYQVQRRLDLSQSAKIICELSSDCVSKEPIVATPVARPLPTAAERVTQSAIGPRSGRDSRLNSQASLISSISSEQQHAPVQHALASGHHHKANELHYSPEELDRPVSHKPMVLIRIQRNYDLVLQFHDVQQRRRFLSKLQDFLGALGKSLCLYRCPLDLMLANAETKEKRQQRLEQFFREAYSLTFAGSNPSNSKDNAQKHHHQQVSPDVGLIMRTSLSRQEFAEALGMKCDSLFVKQMFNCIDKDGNGSISFQEFLDTAVMFSRGRPEDRLRIIFDMCDHNHRGEIDKQDLIKVLCSLVDLAKTSRSMGARGESEMIAEMFKAAGLQDKKLLTYDDFKLLVSLSNHEQTPAPASGAESPQSSPSTTSIRSSGSAPGWRLAGDAANQIQAIGLDMKGAKKNFFVDTSNSASSISGRASLDNHAAPSDGRLFGANDDAFTTPTSVQASRSRRLTMVDSGARQASAQSRLPLELQISTGGLKGSDSSSSSSSSSIDNTKGKADTKDSHQAKAKTNSKLFERWRSLITELEQNRQQIVYLLMFYVIVAVLFFERFIKYSFLSEHMDLRHVMGWGIAITRGSAASLSFCFAMLLLSMCRNLITWIRTLGLREYIPLDSQVTFHKIVAMTGLVMALLHSVGHCVNFFHVSQQPVEHLRCLTKEMQFSSESRPNFSYWVFRTVTGLTGIALWALCSVVYVFAHPRVRKSAYSFFWSTHKLYYLIYALSLLHGSSKLTGSPKFWIFFIIPACLFTLDKIISLQTKLLQLEVIETECLPSDVVMVKFARPPSFKFLSGQWIRLACTAFRAHEFHAFTLTSAPQDDFLSVHVRAQGPWTWKLRSLFEPTNLHFRDPQEPPPRMRIEGPFGGGNQDWYKFEVAVMIGGGIGVTPYASILNDLVFSTSTGRYSGFEYKKLYFIWICPSHKSFEWFIDTLKEVEDKDVTNILEMHIFITQFFHKFDLRTTMLYICENHFQRISNRSLFTGLKAINHFGRPNMEAILQHVQHQHSSETKVGVFSCGPKAMTKSITEACEKVNRMRKLPFFMHQYENFS